MGNILSAMATFSAMAHKTEIPWLKYFSHALNNGKNSGHGPNYFH